MSRKSKTLRAKRRGHRKREPTPRNPIRRWHIVSAVILIGGLVAWAVFSSQGKAPLKNANPKVEEKWTLSVLLALSRNQLNNTDIALMNLLCADGLRGSGGLDVDKALLSLNEMAIRVRVETDRHMYRFASNRAEFQNSEAYYRMLMMATVLYEDLRIRYNPARISESGILEPNDKFFANSKDVFIHGLTGPPAMGTCSSMPVLLTAIGRRLKYPVSLVPAKAHLFVRWEDKNERLNIEATSAGLITEDDAHYVKWPYPISDEEVKHDGYLKSMNGSEELACFLSTRAFCMMADGRYPGAVANLREATRHAPQIRCYRNVLEAAEREASKRAAALRMHQFEEMQWLLDHEGQMNVPPMRRPPTK